MEIIPTAVFLTTYDEGAEDFMLTPLDGLIEKIGAGQLRIQIGPVFKLDQIAEGHRCMEENKAGGQNRGLNLNFPAAGPRSEPPGEVPHTARVPAAGILYAR